MQLLQPAGLASSTKHFHRAEGALRLCSGQGTQQAASAHIATATSGCKQQQETSGQVWGMPGFALDWACSKVLLPMLYKPQQNAKQVPAGVGEGWGDLRFCPGQGAQQGALANIGQAHKANVRQALHFQDEDSPLPCLARLPLITSRPANAYRLGRRL